MIRKIVIFGDPVLRKVGAKVQEISEEVCSLVGDMIETMRHADGVGLAAQQVGVAMQVAVVDVAGIEDRPSEMWVGGQPVAFEEYMPMVLINPVLELGSDREQGTEGCLSFPRMNGEILRSAKVRCRALNLKGEALDFEASGLLARALQHEVDHLNGVLFIDRMDAASKAALGGKLKRLQKGGG
jgi:peptide deformylase